MRTVVKLSKLIPKEKALEMLNEYSEFIKENTGIECQWYIEQHDFSFIPTVPDSAGDLKPTAEYHKALEDDVHKRYGDYGTDNILVWIHEDEFFLKGIWGVNRSYFYHKYSTQFCRWDKHNRLNTFGTLNHEIAHSFDTLISKELGIDINKLFGFNWDSVAVHGEGKWEYVGRKNAKENTESLKMITPYITKAYAKRKTEHTKETVGLLKQAIILVSTMVALLFNRKSVR